MTSKEYSITYLHGAVTVFNGLLHSFAVTQQANNELYNVTLELIKPSAAQAPHSSRRADPRSSPAMSFNWYKILNVTEFLAADISSREVQVILQGIGGKTVLVTSGILVSLIYDGVMLSPGLLGENPFVFGGYAAYIDSVNQDLWLGIPIQ